MRIVEELVVRVDRMAVFAPVRAVVVSHDEQAEPEPPTRGDSSAADGQTFMIEYVGSDGRKSCRRISVRRIACADDGAILVGAFCHERRAARTFRADRIVAVIDYDGEVFDDVLAYLAENFDLPNAPAARVGPSEERRARLRRVTGDWAVLLKSMALADRRVLDVERTMAIDLVAREIERKGEMLDDADLVWIGRYLDRIRPDSSAIERALARFAERPIRERERFLNAAIEIMDADQIRHDGEMDLIDLFAFEMLGAGIGRQPGA